MRELLWILRFRARAAGRFLWANAFVFLVLAPLILGGLLLVVDRYLSLARDVVVGGLAPPVSLAGTPGLLAALWLTAFGLAAVFHELYPRRHPNVMLEWLPVGSHVRFHAAWLACLAANATAAGALVAVGWLLGRGAVDGAPMVAWMPQMLAAFLPLVGLQMLAVLIAVHVRVLRTGAGLAVGGALTAMAVGVQAAPALGWLLLPWVASARQLEQAFAAALGVGKATDLRWADSSWFLVLSALGTWMFAWHLTRRWRRRDRLVAHALDRARRGALARGLAGVTRGLSPPVAAQVVRDGLLVLRRFSPAVLVSAGLALLWLAAMVTVVPGLGLNAFWHGRLALIAATAAVVSSVALVPFVLRHELPRFWIERAAGVSADQIWRAKLWLSRLLALPVALVGIVGLLSVPGTPTERGVYALELLLAAWVVSSLVGLATFEIADRPLLGLIFGALVALAWASLMLIYRQLVPFWLVGYAIVAATLGDRATRRVRFTEVLR